MRQLSLDTKGVCFLCLEKICSDDGNPSLSSWVTEFCLRSISRFLKIDQTSNTYDFSVQLCQTCYNISSKLASMITELEKLKLMLDHQIIMLHETLEKSQIKQGSMWTVWECKSFHGVFERQMKVEATLIDTLRLETEEKCRLFIENRSKKSPRVMLPRLEDQQTRKRKLVELQTNTEQISSVSVDTKKTRVKLPPVPEVIPQIVSGKTSDRRVEIKAEKLEDDYEAQSIDPLALACMPTTMPTETMNLKSPTNIATKLRNVIISNKNSIEVRQQPLLLFDQTKHVKTGEEYKCPFCEISFSCCSTIDFDVHLHLSNVHPDKLFSSKRSPQVPDETFKKICLDLLLSEVKNTPRLTRHLQPTLYSCLYCIHVVEKAQSIKCHYIKSHFEILSEKLAKLQHHNSTNHQGAVIKHGTAVTSSVTLSIHPVPPPPPRAPVSLPVTPAVPIPLSSINRSYVSNYPNPSDPSPLPQQCRQIQAVQDYSQKQQALPSFPTLPPYNTGNQYNNNRNSVGNQYNQAHYYYQTDYGTGHRQNNEMMKYYYPNVTTNHHLQRSYSNYIQPQVQVYQSPVILEETGTQKFHSENTPKEIALPSSNNSNQRKMDSSSMHTVQLQLDEDIFSESRLSWIDLDQFKTLRNLFIQREVDMCTKTIPEESRRIIIHHCPYCTETFSEKNALRFHLCNQHYYILRENLKKVQESHMESSVP